MTAQHIADHIKQIFAKYRWPDTLVSDNGPCYASETFKGLMKQYQVNHITSSPPLSPIKKLFHKAKEEGQDLHKCLMTYRNTPLSSHLQSLMQIISGRTTWSSLPLSNTAKKQMGLHSEEVRMTQKNEHLPTHDLCLDQTAITKIHQAKMVSSKNHKVM